MPGSPHRMATLRSRVAAAAADTTLTPQTRLVLRALEVVEPPTGDFFVRVFVNLPQASASTPITDPHYAGSFAFFADHEAKGHVHGNATFLVDATATVRRLHALGRIGSNDEVSVQLVAVRQGDAPARQDRLRVGGLELQWADSDAPAPRPLGQPLPQK